MGDETKKLVRYAYLPQLTPEAFDALVTKMHAKNRGRPVSDRSIAMVRSVLLEGATFAEAGAAQDRIASQAKQAVHALLKYWQADCPVRMTGLEGTADGDVRGKPFYRILPRLTLEEFEALAEVARTNEKLKSKISEITIAMARAVLMDGMTYQEAADAGGGPSSSASRQAVVTLLREYKETRPVEPHTLFRLKET